MNEMSYAFLWSIFFINLHDLLLFVNLSILFMKIQPTWYFVWLPIWQSSDICIVQFQYLSTNSYFINCVELSWWQIPGMIHVTYIVCHGIKLCLVNVLEAACQLFNIFYMTLCLWQNVYRQSINRTRHRYIVDFKLVYCACNGIYAIMYMSWKVKSCYREVTQIYRWYINTGISMIKTWLQYAWT